MQRLRPVFSVLIACTGHAGASCHAFHAIASKPSVGKKRLFSGELRARFHNTTRSPDQ
jgi:hypothetical protein